MSKSRILTKIVNSNDKDRYYVFDDDGEYITIKDELTGKEARKLELKKIGLFVSILGLLVLGSWCLGGAFL